MYEGTHVVRMLCVCVLMPPVAARGTPLWVAHSKIDVSQKLLQFH